MLVDECAAQRLRDAESAREDSLVLWRNLIFLKEIPNADGAPAFSSDAPERCPLDLAGRYQVGDGNEFAGKISEVSPLGLRVKGPKPGRVGNWCTANVATIGIVEGMVVQARQDSFIVGVVAPTRRLRRLARRLNWHLRRVNNAEVIERRSSERVEMNYAQATLETTDGQVFPCNIFDLSSGGAALHIGPKALYFWIDQAVKLDGRPGRVLRYFPGGVAIQFD